VPGLIVKVRERPPELTAEDYGKFLTVYRGGKFLGLYEPGREYGPQDVVTTIESVYGGTVTFPQGHHFANVIGSTNDPKIDGQSWLDLWYNNIRVYPTICTSYHFQDFQCGTNLVGGHVVEGHGFNHEIARYLPRDEEDQVMKKTIAMIQKRTGRRCYGWRSCTQSTNTIELLIDNGFVFNTNCFHEELPFLWEKDGKLLVELPRQPFGDGTLFGHRHGEYGNPYHGLETWKAYFDELYSESSAERPKYIPFTMHPYIIGRPGRTLALRGIIQHMKKAGNLWFPTGIELAEWCLNNVFQAECQKLRASAG